jgi:hypothetical protein
LLASVRRLAIDQTDWVVKDADRRGQVIGVRFSQPDPSAEDEPSNLLPAKKQTERPIQGPFPKSVEIVRGNFVFVPKAGLSEPMLNRIIRIAAFQNPDFY